MVLTKLFYSVTRSNLISLKLNLGFGCLDIWILYVLIISGHAFHLQCVATWLNSNKQTCPICRADWEYGNSGDRQGTTTTTAAATGGNAGGNGGGAAGPTGATN
jgi:hypothetical protein